MAMRPVSSLTACLRLSRYCARRMSGPASNSRPSRAKASSKQQTCIIRGFLTFGPRAFLIDNRRSMKATRTVSSLADSLLASPPKSTSQPANTPPHQRPRYTSSDSLALNSHITSTHCLHRHAKQGGTHMKDVRRRATKKTRTTSPWWAPEKVPASDTC